MPHILVILDFFFSSLYCHTHCVDIRCPLVQCIVRRPKSRHRGIGTHQRQRKREERKTSDKNKEKERDRGTDGETLNPIEATEALIENEE